MKASRAKAIEVSAASDGAGRSGLAWVQRLGAAGFLFFLIKGLLWLAIPALLAYMGYG